MTRIATTCLAAISTSILVLSVLSGATLGSGHPSGAELARGPGEVHVSADGTAVPALNGAPVPAAVGPSVPLAHPAATTAAIASEAAAPHPFLPPVWGVWIHADGSVSGSASSHVTATSDRYYNFTADTTGSILDQRNGSDVSGGSWGFSNSTGNPIDLMVLNATNVQLEFFFFYSGFQSVLIVGSTNVTVSSVNNTLEPDDSATYGGSEEGATIVDSTEVMLGGDDFNGTNEAVDVLNSNYVTVEGNDLSGGLTGGGDGVFADEVTELYIEFDFCFQDYTGIYVENSNDVGDDEVAVAPDQLVYGAVYQSSTEVSSYFSNFSAVEEDGLYLLSDSSVSVYADNASGPLAGNGIYAASTLGISVSDTQVYGATASITSSGIYFDDDSCEEYYCDQYDNSLRFDAVGITIVDSPGVDVEDSDLIQNEWGMNITGSSGGDVSGSNLSNSGWFIGEGVGILMDNSSYFTIEQDTISSGFGPAAVELYADTDTEFEHDHLANTSNIGLRAGANSYLEVAYCDLTTEFNGGTGSVGAFINSSTDVDFDSNNVSGNTVGVIDFGVSAYGEFDNNLVGNDQVGLMIEHGNSFDVDQNSNGVGLAAVQIGVDLVGDSGADVIDNNFAGPSFLGVIDNLGVEDYIQGNNLSGNEYGIYFYQSSTGEAYQNDLNGTTSIGIYADLSQATDIYDNYVVDGAVGALDDDGLGVSVYGNDFAGDSDEGAAVQSSADTIVHGNNLTDAAVGVVVINSFDTVISLNQFVGTPASVSLGADVGVTLFQNDFVNVGSEGWEMQGDTNVWWNSTYPAGGNYWSNLTETADIESGPNQNIAGADGINDTPFAQGHGAVTDFYPLVYPIAAAPPELVFTETGLPSYTQWHIIINVSFAGESTESYTEYGYSYGSSSSVSLSTEAAAFGTYMYTVKPVNGFVVAPSSGTGTITHGTTTTPIVFTPFPYTVTFAATGITSGTSWNVTVNGHTYTSTTLWNNVSLGNGTHDWSAWTAGAPSVLGNVTVHSAATDVAVPFHPPTYSVVFTQTGLPAGATWTVTFNGVAATSSSNVIMWNVTNGTYSYTVTNTGTSTPSQVSGQVTVDGSGKGVAESFTSPTSTAPPGEFAVVFTETGLATGATWTVTLNGVAQPPASGDAISFAEKNGTYSYSVTTSGSVAPVPASGSVTVAGAAVGTAIAFSTSAGGTTTTPSGGNSGVSSTDLYIVIAVAVLLGILAVIGWARGGRPGSPSPSPSPPSWGGPVAPPPANAPPPGTAGAPPPAWQEPPAGGPPAPPPSA